MRKDDALNSKVTFTFLQRTASDEQSRLGGCIFPDHQKPWPIDSSVLLNGAT